MISVNELKENGYKKFTVKDVKMYVKIGNGYNIYIGMSDLIPISAIMVYGGNEIKKQKNFTIDIDEYFTLIQIEKLFKNHYERNILINVI